MIEPNRTDTACNTNPIRMRLLFCIANCLTDEQLERSTLNLRTMGKQLKKYFVTGLQPKGFNNNSLLGTVFLLSQGLACVGCDRVQTGTRWNRQADCERWVLIMSAHSRLQDTSNTQRSALIAHRSYDNSGETCRNLEVRKCSINRSKTWTQH